MASASPSPTAASSAAADSDIWDDWPVSADLGHGEGLRRTESERCSGIVNADEAGPRDEAQGGNTM